MMNSSNQFAGRMLAVRSKNDSIDKVAAWCGIIWLVVNMDVCYMWFFPKTVRYLMGAPFVFFATLYLSQVGGLILTKRRSAVFFTIVAFALLVFVTKSNPLVVPFKFGPLACLVFWRGATLLKMFRYFRNYIVFYAVLSIFIEFLVISGLWMRLPHTTFPPQDFVQESLGIINYFYGIFCIPVQGNELTFYRACGPLREGGHFAIYLGFIYFAEKAILKKRNIWVVICGILTLSPNFLMAVIITESFLLIKNKSFSKSLYAIVGTAFLGAILFFSLQQTIQEEVVHIVMDRNLERNLGNVSEAGLMALIDGRSNEYSLLQFESFKHESIYVQLTGTKIPEELILSDFRFIILLYGYIGALLVLLCILFLTIWQERNFFGFGLLMLAIIIYAHRAWMYHQMYIYTILLLISNAHMVVEKYDKKLKSIRDKF